MRPGAMHFNANATRNAACPGAASGNEFRDRLKTWTTLGDDEICFLDHLKGEDD